MKRKLYFMLPNIRSAHQAWKEMLLARVDNRHIHFLASPGTPLGKMQPADMLERTDALHEAGMGIFVGAALGFAAGVLTLVAPTDYFPMWYTNLDPIGILAITTAIGAIAGCAGMALLGTGLTNTDLDAVNDRISRGEVMMIVAVPLLRVKEIWRIMQKLHPEATYYGVWPSVYPVFP